jgi:hypothetical protein
MLDPQKVKDDKLFWQITNTVVPVLLVVIFGILLTVIRKRTYARKAS